MIKHRLGQGFASHVYLAVDIATRRTLALKMYAKSKLTPMYQHQVFREIQIHARMRHEHIVKLFGAFEDSAAFYLVMEYAPGGDLYTHFKHSGGRYSEACVVRSILRPFLSALAYIHSLVRGSTVEGRGVEVTGWGLKGGCRGWAQRWLA